jgi:riboflavin kinase / FMN adenylyltransferase
LRPDAFQPLLTTIDARAALLQSYGADHVVILDTAHGLLSLEAREFFDRIIVDRLRARGLVEGYNFAFGRNRGGTMEVLQQYCHESNLPLTLLSAQEVLGKPVSSSRVRHEILAGAMTNVTELLARPYRIAGTVATGQGRGQKLGIPTANLDAIPTLVPGDGVYPVRAWHAGKSWPGAANVGPNPTFGEKARKVEVHLIAFSGNLYGQTIAVDFLDKIRDTRPFGSVQDLVAQIERDIETARQACAR